MRIRPLFFIVLLSVVLISCSKTSSISEATSSMLTSFETTTPIITSTTTNGPIRISALEGKALLDANPNIILVDVRTIDEFLEVRIPGAISAPLADLVLVAENLLPDKNAIYIIYCRTGNKSAEAVRMLFELGYTTLYDMGGIYSWPYETIS